MITVKSRRVSSYVAGDIITLAVGFLSALYLFREVKFSKIEWLIFTSFTFLWFIIEYWRKLTSRTIDNKFRQRILNHIKAYGCFIVLVVLFYYFSPVPVYHRGRVIGVIFSIALIDIAGNVMMKLVIRSIRKARYRLKHVLIAGVGTTARNVESQLIDEGRAGYNLRGFINCSEPDDPVIENERVLGDLNTINQFLENNAVDEIVIALPTHYKKEIQDVLTVADYHGIRTKYILDYKEIFGSQYRVTKLGHIDAVNIRQLPMDSPLAQFWKASFDKLFATVFLVLLAPLFLLIAIAIKLDSRGPVFYCPVRIGRSGKPFKVFKFRSMRTSDDSATGVMSTTKNDPRITRLGKFLRKTSIDELPQFINVLIGNMSVVGPRPHRRFLDRHLQETVYKYMLRHYVKPGITGWAQVNGWRGPSETEEQKLQRTYHDLHYIENWTFWMDIKIIFLTIFSSKVHKSAF